MIDTEKIQRHIKESGNRRVFAGFSGGADSTALVLILSRIPGIGFKAIHFKHELRKEEGEIDADFCRKFCADRNIDFEMIGLGVPENMYSGENVEAAARRLRLQKWMEMCAGETEKPLIALGHHLDDRIENLFIRLCRGSNASGLVSLLPEQFLKGMKFIRPLTEYRRSEIEDFLRSEGVEDWREDSSNRDTAFKRNFFRHRIIPEMFGEIDFAEKGIAHSLHALEEDAAFIEIEAQKAFSEAKEKEETSVEFWRKLHPAVRVRVLRSWLTYVLAEDTIPPRSTVIRFEEAISRQEISDSGETVLIPVRDDTFIRIRKDLCTLIQRSESEMESPPALQWRWKKDSTIKWAGKELHARTTNRQPEIPAEKGKTSFDAALLPEKLVLRSWLPGDRMQPFEAEKNVRLKKIFSGKKITTEEKNSQPLLCLPSGEIIWIPGVRRSNFAPVSEKTGEYAIFSISFDNINEKEN